MSEVLQVAIPEAYTKPDAARAAGVSVRTLDGWIAEGRLPVIRDDAGRVWLIRREALASCLAAMEEPVAHNSAHRNASSGAAGCRGLRKGRSTQ